jgi:acetylornithine deacetylase/succinyl-diaminopimelate desuccinylase-like protein
MTSLRNVVAAGVLVLCSAAAQAALSDDVLAYRKAHEAAIVMRLGDLTRMRSVPADPAGLTAIASTLREALKERGFAAQLLTAPGAPPVVFGERKAPGAKHTVVFYAHYDGQPVTPSEWHSEPFTPVIRAGKADAPEIDWRTAKPPFDPEWRMFGRAVSDDKSSIVAFLTAVDALHAAGRSPSVNIKVVWEGEEERSSPHLEGILRGNLALLASDLWLIGDGPMHQSRAPTLYFGARGTLGMEATIYGPVNALHDGHYGNWVPNPAVLAAEFIGSLRDSEGGIAIPDFASDVRPLTAAETKAIAQLPPVEAELKKEFGIGRSEGSAGLTASTMRPAINVRGFRAGQVGASAANAIPTDATVSIDFRLVPDQTPDGVQKKVEDYLRAKGWTIVSTEPDAATRAAHGRIIKLTWGGGYPALRSDMDSPAAKAVIASAARAAGKQIAVLPMMGGSVPINMFADIFKVPIIGLPIANHDNNQHAADENLRLANLWDGIATYAGLMADLKW